MHEKLKIRTKDCRTISITSFAAATANGKNLIIAPAVEVVQKDYEKFAVHFQRLGYNVVTFDYRGIGDSAPLFLKGFDAGLQQWAVQDIDAVIRFVRSAFPGNEIIFIGHGIGGELIGLAQASQYINKLALVSSSLSCKKYWSWRGQLKITVLKTAARLANKWFGYFPGTRFGMRRDLPKGVMNELTEWCDNPNGLFDVYPENNYRKLEVPLFAFSFANDWMTPDRSVRKLLGYFSSASITWYHIHPKELGLNGKKNYCFFETQLQTSTWVMLQQWLNEETVSHQLLPLNI